MYGLSLRATKGFLDSIIHMLGLDLKVPCYSTLSRRQKQLNATLEKPQDLEEHQVLAIDSTGLKVFSEGEWKTRTHGWAYRRVWRKLHLAIDTETQQIQAVMVSTNDCKDSQLLDDLLDQVTEPVRKVVADGVYESHANLRALKLLVPNRWSHRESMRKLGNMVIARK